MRAVAAISAFLALAGPSLAADYLRGSQVEEPVYGPVPVFTWGGIYGGGFAGISGANFDPRQQGRDLAAEASANPFVGPVSGLFAFKESSVQRATYGAFLGYNWQFEDIVYGIEGEVGFGSLRSSQTLAMPLSVTRTLTADSTTRVGNQFLLKARAGYAWNRFLTYLTIGGGAVKMDATGSLRVTDVGVDVLTTLDKSNYTAALSVGLGVDWAPIDNLFVRAELQGLFVAAFNGVETSIYTARLGAGVKF